MADNFNVNHYSAKDGHWLNVIKSIQTLDEVLNNLETSLKTQTGSIHGKVRELLAKDQKSVEQSWESLRSNWTSKCREINTLKKNLSRMADEKIRLRDENQRLEKSISRLQEQFSQSVSSSLIEIQSLTSANSDLSEQLHRIEESLKTESSKIKKNIHDKFDSCKKILHETMKNKDKAKNLDAVLEDEAMKIETTLIDGIEGLKFSKLAVDSAREVGQSIENKRLESMETHLQELEKEVADKNERIKKLENIQEISLQERTSVVSEINEEERNWFDYIKRAISPGKVSQDECLEVFEVSLLIKGLQSAKHLVVDMQENLADVYKGSVNSQDELHDMRDNIDEVTMKLKSTHSKLETVEGENEYLKRKIEQEENKLKVSRDENISLQSRIHMLKQEKEAVDVQINDMKGGREDFKEFCSNLSAENEKLFGEISRVQAERDSVLEQLQDASKKLANNTKESQNLQEKYDNIEKALVKIKREYQEQVREMQNYVKENEEMRLLINEKEFSFNESKNELRNIDIVNKDLEDQVFQLTSENEKMQLDMSKLKANKKQLEIEIKEKKLVIERLESSEKILEEKLREKSQAERNESRQSLNLKNELEINESVIIKSLDRISALAEILRQIMKLTKSSYLEFDGANTDKGLLEDFDTLIKLDMTDEDENILKNGNKVIETIARAHAYCTQNYKDVIKFLTDVNATLGKAEIRFKMDETDDKDIYTNQEKMSQSKTRLSWIVQDYKRLCNGPIQVGDSEKMQNLKEIILKYTVAATKQLEALFDKISGKDWFIMLLPTCKNQEESSEGANEDLLTYVRETFRSNQIALESAVSTLELVKLRGESDIVSNEELMSKIINSEQAELCQMMKRMNQMVDSLTAKVQNFITNAGMVRSSSTSSFENDDTLSETAEISNTTTLQIKALKSLVNKRDSEIAALQADINFMKMEREHLMSELQEKDFDLGKLEEEMKRLNISSTGLEEQFSRMKQEYDNTSKELAEREKELKALKEAMSQQDREGDAGELSSTESARSEIERKENELRRLMSSLEDIRNVHSLNEGRIKKLQNKIEGVSQIITNRDSIQEETAEETGKETSSCKEQRLIVREIELKTSKAQFCDAEDLKRSHQNAEQVSVAGKENEITKQLQIKEKENSFLQSVVKELKIELLAVQQEFSKEQQSKSELHNMMNNRQLPRNSNNLNADKHYENEQLRRRNREYQQIRRNYRDDSFDLHSNIDDNSLNVSYNSPKHFGYPPVQQDRYAHDCEICAIESVSGASTYICSDEECDCDFASCEMSDTSFASDDEYDRSRMVSPGYRSVYSKEARNVSLQEATYAIKSQHRRNLIHRNASPIHNAPYSPKRQAKRHSAGYESPGSKYTPSQIIRSNSARSAVRPRSATASSDTSEHKQSINRRSFSERRPVSESNHYYKREIPYTENPGTEKTFRSRSLHSSDECSSISSGSGICSGSGTDGQHECKKRKQKSMKGKLV